MPDFRKHDSGKAPLALLPFDSLEPVARVLKFGAEKYGRDNWRNMQPEDRDRLLSAALRHIGAVARGEDDDPETALPHLAHAVCSLLFLLAPAREAEMKEPELHPAEAGQQRRYVNVDLTTGKAVYAPTPNGPWSPAPPDADDAAICEAEEE